MHKQVNWDTVGFLLQEAMIDALKLDGKNSHDALDDTLACGELFRVLMQRIPKLDACAAE